VESCPLWEKFVTFLTINSRYEYLDKRLAAAEMGDRLATVDMGGNWG